MQLGLTLKLTGQSRPSLDMALVREAEQLGYASVWCGESYGSDAVTPIAFVLAQTSRIKAGTAIMQMPARSPACAAMTAITLQALSGNRFLCGIGPSGPQVVEGWHGVAYGKPLGRTREYAAIIRQIVAREAPLTHHGEHYRIPYDGPGASGLGKPLKSIAHGDPSLPIYTAAFMPAGLRVAGEIADGTLPIFMSPERADLITAPILEGMAKAGRGDDLRQFDIAPYVKVRVGEDVAACRDALRPELALYIGGMGARSKNFYNAYARALGYEEAAERIQTLFLDGKKAEAAAAVPDALIDEIALIGPPARIRDRLAAWQAAARNGAVGTLVLTGATAEALRVVAEAVL
ncbi:MAG: LLM class F420-dependent oxidoreductase [Rhodospirillales bacterium]|nr:LLM class F420-dependent oxidoreductase [Rhodospirillales bacterium]